MKYITTKNNAIIIFSKGFSHKEIAQKLNEEVRGAGFVNLDTKECSGQSISLKIGVHERDNRTLEFHHKGY